ncbi:putative transcription factor GeBP family [Helianthus annuus]|nr:putative transcription factor GeBP family [Helianthus annuus]
MASDDEHHTTTAYEQDLDDEEQSDDEIDEQQQQQQHHQNIDEEDDVVSIDDEEEEEDDAVSDDSTSSAAGEVTIAVAGSLPTVTTPIAATPTTATTTTASIVRSDAIIEPKKPLDDSRRLFQRLWTDEDEIELLQGFLEYTTQRGANSSHHHDTTAFYDQIRGKLQLEFNKNQLVEKLRRLKKKYRNVLAKTSGGKEYVFKSPHDQATFDLCCKIWNEPVAVSAVPVPVMADGGGFDDDEAQNPNPNPNHSTGYNLNEHNGNGIGDPNSSEKKAPRPRKRSRLSAIKIEENYTQQQQYGQGMGAGAGAGAGASNSNAAVSNLVEETVKSCLLPLFKELVNNSPNGGLGLGLGGMGGNTFGSSMNFPIGDMSDEKWRKQHILELEVYSKRLELMQDQIKSKLEELRSMGSI